MPVFCLTALGCSAQGIPGDAAKILRLEQGFDGAPFGRGQHHAAWTKQLQAVPGGRIVTGRDLDGARGLQSAHRQATRRSRSHPQIEHFATAGQQTSQHGMAQQEPARPTIAADDNPPSLGKGGEGCRERRGRLRDQAFAQDSPDPRNTHNQVGLLRHILFPRRRLGRL